MQRPVTSDISLDTPESFNAELRKACPEFRHSPEEGEVELLIKALPETYRKEASDLFGQITQISGSHAAYATARFCAFGGRLGVEAGKEGKTPVLNRIESEKDLALFVIRAVAHLGRIFGREAPLDEFFTCCCRLKKDRAFSFCYHLRKATSGTILRFLDSYRNLSPAVLSNAIDTYLSCLSSPQPASAKRYLAFILIKEAGAPSPEFTTDFASWPGLSSEQRRLIERMIYRRDLLLVIHGTTHVLSDSRVKRFVDRLRLLPLEEFEKAAMAFGLPRSILAEGDALRMVDRAKYKRFCHREIVPRMERYLHAHWRGNDNAVQRILGPYGDELSQREVDLMSRYASEASSVA